MASLRARFFNTKKKEKKKDKIYYEDEIKGMYDQLKENIIHAQEIAKTSSWTYDIQKDEYFYTIEIFSILGCKFEEFDYKLENYLDFMHPEYIDTYKKYVNI